MKKTIRMIIRFIRAIIRFFDKWLITPITKLILLISDLLKDNSKGFERFINNKQTLIVLSLIFALGTFFIVDKNSDMIINQSAEILYGQPVTAVYNEEAYVVEGLPETVDITLIGRRSDIYLAKQYPTHTVSVDLSELTPGSHKVSLKYKQSLSSITYKLDPATATIIIYDKVAKTMELTYDIYNKESLDTKLIISDVKLSRDSVIIKGAEYKVNQVATVKALIDINELSNIQTGEVKASNVKLAAYDSLGQPVDVEIVPTTIDATLTIDSPSEIIDIVLVPTGELAFGKSIKSLTSSVTKITVYGEKEAVKALKESGLEVEVSLEDISANKEFNITLKNPSGIREMSTNTIIVDLEVSDAITKEFKNISITPVNLPDGLKAQAIDEENSKVTVKVTGSSDIVNAITEEKIAEIITAELDLSSYTKTGTYDVPVKVTGSDLRLSYEATTDTRKIKIYK